MEQNISLRDIFNSITESRIVEVVATSNAVQFIQYSLIPFVKTLFALIIVASLGVIIYTILRKIELSNAEHVKYRFTPPPRGEKSRSPRWDMVLDHISGESPTEWKMAILESDNILYEMVRTMGYPGESLGEMLKNIEQSDFTTIHKAWEAHKVRNAIAHEGSEYEISKKEARRIVALYEDVFREFDYI